MNEIAVGQVWKEVDPRVERYVRVQHVSLPEVLICTCSDRGSILSTRITSANAKRFNGKRGGYALQTAGEQK